MFGFHQFVDEMKYYGVALWNDDELAVVMIRLKRENSIGWGGIHF